MPVTLRSQPLIRADVVVVGAGTAGSVVAGRLAERRDRTVLVLEAGPDHGSLGSAGWPADLLDATHLPDSHDWGYQGTGSGGQPLRFDRARVVGGCSAHNGCSQTVGWAGDYDAWAASGLSGWGAQEFSTHLRTASERMRIRRYRDDEVQPFHRAFVAASVAAGLPQRADLDRLDGKPGVDIAPINIVDGNRWNAAFAYLDPVRHLPEFTITDVALVSRVLVDSGRVVGVEYIREGESHLVECGHVVLASGAYGTPEVLLRSGIGPADELTTLGITVQADLPGVGRNLHDHPTVAYEFDASAELVRRLDAFGSTAGWVPEEQSIAKAASSVADGPFDLHIYPWVEPRADSLHGWAVVLPVGLLTPRSRGSLRLRSNDPLSLSSPDHRYLSDPSDVVALSDGITLLDSLVADADFAQLLGRRRNPPEVGESRTDWMRRTHTHYWHPAGTTAMGIDPRTAVTHANGAVHGVTGLTVADASLFPAIPRATPALPVVAAAELIAAGIA